MDDYLSGSSYTSIARSTSLTLEGVRQIIRRDSPVFVRNPRAALHGAIRAALRAHTPHAVIVKDYGVSRSTVTRIKATLRTRGDASNIN